jgi:hypothetical protein
LVALAEFALVYKHRPGTAAGWYRQAFANSARYADDVNSGHRYNAACAAVMAASNSEPGELTDNERVAWRAQALEWLTAELDAIRGKSELPARPQMAQTLAHWLQDPDLAAIRNVDRLKLLPEGERELCEALWRDVTSLLARLKETPQDDNLNQTPKLTPCE